MGIINSAIKIFVGDKVKKDIKAIEPILNEIKQYEKSISSLGIDDLRAKTSEFKATIQEAQKHTLDKISVLKEKIEVTQDIRERDDIYAQIDTLEDDAYKEREEALNSILPEAFAVVRDTARRFAENEVLEVKANEFDRKISGVKSYVTLNGEKAMWSNSWDAAGKQISWDMIHYDVQLIGGIVLHQGKVSEMQTGEGKTLVATLPLYLNALTGRGVHLVTVNDYLARRDSAWMAPIFEFHGLGVDCIDIHQPNSQERRDAYNSDIIYGTNNEFGFDYLRDNMSHTMGDLVQRKHNYAIVDEVDSVLIDDARTPLIISGPVPEGDRHEFNRLKPVVESVVMQQRRGVTGFLSEAKKLISEGNTKDGAMLLLRAHRGLPKNKALIKFLSEEGNRQLLQKTENYYMRDNNKEMPEVDAELFFTIDEKTNHVELTEKGIGFMSKDHSDDDFFILPDIGVEIAKIEEKSLSPEEETKQKDLLFNDFGIKSERIHTLSQLLKAYTVFEKDVEYVIMDGKIKIVDEQTGRIMEGRRYSDGLHQAIEAKENVKIEAATQTFATITLQNYFRMYSKLSGMTGTAITEAGELWEIYKLDVVEIPTNRPISRKDQNDLIYKTKREKYNAIAQDISKLTEEGRPVLIGTTSVEVSELLSKMLKLHKIKHNVLNAKLHKKEADIVAEAGDSGVVTIATNMAGRGTDIKIDEGVKKAGGLAIIGTERHDSRRVDRQLRGRSGRQGDPGSSQFYASLEDNLMRLFGSERISKVMDKMGHKEGDVIQHGMMTRSIERAQKKVEENNFGIRKRLLEYDDVMNAQREVIYRRRRNALEGTRLKVDISNMIHDTAKVLIERNKQTVDYKNLEYDFVKYFSIPPPVSPRDLRELSRDELVDKIYDAAFTHYSEKSARNAETAYPVIQSVFEKPDNKFERIVVPFTDGTKTLNIVTNLTKAYETKGESLILDFEKNVCLAIIDENWKNHLRGMDELKQSVQLAVHEQKDPLLIYKFEAFELFKGMIEKVNTKIITFLFGAELPEKGDPNIKEAENNPLRENIHLSKEEILNTDEQAIRQREVGRNASQSQKTETIIRKQPKIGRNDRVTLVNTTSAERKEMKYKQAILLIRSGEWVIEDNI